MLGHVVTLRLAISEELLGCFLQGLHPGSPPVVCERLSFSTSWSALGIIKLIIATLVRMKCCLTGFGLCYPDVVGHLFMFTGHLGIFFGEMAIQNLCSFKIHFSLL